MKNLNTCPYCGSPTKFLSSSESVYAGQDFGPVWTCSRFPDCFSFVGTKGGSQEPLGTLANSRTRKWRKRAHAAFDPLWQRKARDMIGEAVARRRSESGAMTDNRERLLRSKARSLGYAWLAQRLGLTLDETHIALFTDKECERVVEVCKPHARGRK